MPIIQANQINIYYEIHGSGQPLVLISGMGGDHYFWQPHVETFAKHFQVITFDNRGIGQTDIPEEPYSIETMADDLAALMQKLGIDKAHVLGFSMGGAIAQAFAVRHPEKLDRLLLGGTFAVLNVTARLFLDAVLRTYQEGAKHERIGELILPSLFSRRFFEQAEQEGKQDFFGEDPHPQPFHGFREQYRAQRAFDYRDELSKIQARTLILAGEQDILAQLPDAEVLHAGIQGSQLIVIPESGHLFNYEEPERFNRTVIDFLSGEEGALTQITHD